MSEAAITKFIETWTGRGDEKAETSIFWISLLQDVLGVDRPTDYLQFEKRVSLKNTGFIDVYLPKTKILVEQKSLDVDLDKAQTQSDGSLLTPYEQGKRYADALPLSEKPRFIITCNFEQFRIYDQEQPKGEPMVILLKDLAKEHYRLDFIADAHKEHLRKEMELSIAAGDIVGQLYDGFLKEYKDPTNPESLKSLNILCVRLVFCLYAEDAGIFGEKDMFLNYLKPLEPRQMRKSLIELFEVLDTPEERRDPYLDESLACFPYVNGGLFAKQDVEIPNFTSELAELLLKHASENFDWSDISPTIFGAVFESTLNQQTRRAGGMHYTSIENIHKLIEPLFLDELKEELSNIKSIKVTKTRLESLKNFQIKLGSLTFLDPACGSGNFLTETYLCLRQMENEVLQLIHGNQISLDTGDIIKVGIHQFYGIEINDFAVTVAKTALWIAESQMMKKTQAIVNTNLDFLPLKSNANIVEGNALRMDWNDLLGPHPLAPSPKGRGDGPLPLTPSPTGRGDGPLPLAPSPTGRGDGPLPLTPSPTGRGGVDRIDRKKIKYDYIIGNPPFVGYSYQSKEQKEDLEQLNSGLGKNIDYVAGWYYKSAELIKNTNIRCALVSTNSICQGEQVAAIWKPIFQKFNIHFDFAWRTFRWDSEASIKAHVHCIIIGFSNCNGHKKAIFTEMSEKTIVKNINGYLIDATNVFIDKQIKPICNVVEMTRGSQPTDNGYLILSEEEKNNLIEKEPQAEKFIRPFMMGKDFIDRKPRYCLWLVGANPAEIKKCPSIVERISKVREFRLNSTKAATRKKAETPMLFDEVKECKSDYIAIPVVSSENRKYVPMDYLSRDVIAGNKLFQISNASLYDFGILTSSVHMAWMRTVCGRLKSDYSYSNTIVYNNFPWPDLTPYPPLPQGEGENVAQVPLPVGEGFRERSKAKIEQTAQAILDARALYPNSSLADLYDESTMPIELRKAHQANDKAVMEAYGFKKDMTEPEIVAELFKMYQKLVENDK